MISLSWFFIAFQLEKTAKFDYNSMIQSNQTPQEDMSQINSGNTKLVCELHHETRDYKHKILKFDIFLKSLIWICLSKVF